MEEKIAAFIKTKAAFESARQDMIDSLGPGRYVSGDLLVTIMAYKSTGKHSVTIQRIGPIMGHGGPREVK